MLQTQFSHIVQLIQQSRENAIRSVNTELINLYWNVGKYISRQLDNANWGEKTVDQLAEFIEKNHSELRGFNRRGLYRMKQFYETYSQAIFVSPKTKIDTTSEVVSSPMAQIQNAGNQSNEIVSSAMTQFEISDIRDTLLTKITWTHHLTLISKTKNNDEREFYIKLAISENYSVKDLERQISSALFERTMIGNSKLSNAVKNVHPSITNAFKDTYVFDFLNLSESHSESDLQNGLIRQMKKFILELGKDFLFIGEEYKVQVGNTDFYIDLLFCHRSLQCLVAIELKADSFKPEHIGQLNFYLEALDRDVRKQNENPSIGVLLCKDKDKEVVEYALSRSLSPTMISEYKMQLPDKKILQQKLHELFESHESAINAEQQSGVNN
jgi:predicted nuclease of restriction endonuclease-like (RecB) superfamily